MVTTGSRESGFDSERSLRSGYHIQGRQQARKLPISDSESEVLGSALGSSRALAGAEKAIKLDYLEEVKVVTRFPWVNLRKDHYSSVGTRRTQRFGEKRRPAWRRWRGEVGAPARSSRPPVGLKPLTRRKVVTRMRQGIGSDTFPSAPSSGTRRRPGRYPEWPGNPAGPWVEDPRSRRPSRFRPRFLTPFCPSQPTYLKQRVQLLAVDHSARASMKNAASCEN
ncbi:hypothetical protein G5714_024705 [Onychostoma macrolepis]|uniref:Uncharacterized protein n=1 Tax=Onychostoma macrolepis TaxID=369639 RepID=A0A7J6BJW8_9TELE|nr:hypothetical protein G5714_024705 [Onychostoma macrolepis]